MGTRSAPGQRGEDVAAAYLSARGWHILTRNDRRQWGEIDIVARAPDNTLVFVEVKTMHAGALAPEDQLSPGKLKRFQTAAALYAGSRPDLVDETKGWRLDAVAIVLPSEPDVVPVIRHYENVG